AVDGAGALVDRVLDERQSGEVAGEEQARDVAALQVLVGRRAVGDGLAVLDAEAAVRADLLAEDDAAALLRARDDRDVPLDREDVEGARVDERVAAEAR